MTISELMRAVAADAMQHDNVFVSLRNTDKGLLGTYTDEMGTIEYKVPFPEVNSLVENCQKEMTESGISLVDSFWYLMNENYKI